MKFYMHICLFHSVMPATPVLHPVPIVLLSGMFTVDTADIYGPSEAIIGQHLRLNPAAAVRTKVSHSTQVCVCVCMCVSAHVLIAHQLHGCWQGIVSQLSSSGTRRTALPTRHSRVCTITQPETRRQHCKQWPGGVSASFAWWSCVCAEGVHATVAVCSAGADQAELHGSTGAG